MAVIGILYRTMVSNSPQQKPKEPSPIAATTLASGFATWAPMAAASA